MSLVEWLKSQYPDENITRPENIYIESRVGLYEMPNYRKDKFVAITRDPLDRIMSGISYFEELRDKPIEIILNMQIPNQQRYMNVGFADPIGQSNYDYFIQKYQQRHMISIDVYRFEDMIGKEFPHINKTKNKRKWTKQEIEYIKKRLDERGIVY